MEIKEAWYKLVAGDLLDSLHKQIDITKEHAKSRGFAEQKIKQLEQRLEVNCKQEDVEIATQIVRERIGMDHSAAGKIEMLRQQLKQELAYTAYLEENVVDGITPFNDLPLETRVQYFERAEEQAR